MRYDKAVCIFIIVFSSFSARAQANKCETFAPPVPDGLYQGPYGRFPSLSKAIKRIKSHGTFFPKKNDRSEYYRFELGKETYFAYFGSEYVETNLVHGDDPETRRHTHIAYLSCEEEADPYWWMELKSWSGESEKNYCALSVFNIVDDKKADMNVPPGSVYYRWECYTRSGNEEYPPYEYKQTMEWNEVIFPDGKVYWPAKRKSSDDSVSWVLADAAKSWLHHPERIPEQVRFLNDPMIKFLMTGKE